MNISKEMIDSLVENYNANTIKDIELYNFFLEIKPLLNLYKYKDPSGVLEASDIESTAFLGFIKAITKYDPTKCENPISWVYQIVGQTIIREIKRTTKKGNVAINSHMNKDIDMESIEDTLSDDFELTTTVYSGTFKQNLFRIYKHIYEINPKAARLYTLLLVFPNLSRKTMAKLVGFQRRNAIAKLVKIIHTVGAKNINRSLIEEDKMTFKEPIYDKNNDRYSIRIDETEFFIAYKNRDETWTFISLLGGVNANYKLTSEAEIEKMVNNLLKLFMNKYMTKI